MLGLFVLSALSLASTCTEPVVTYHGHPNCVVLTHAGAQTLLTNRCDQPLLVDQSVQTTVALSEGPLVVPDAQVALRDLNRFTLGFEGRLHQVVATVTCEAPSHPEEPVTAAQSGE